MKTGMMMASLMIGLAISVVGLPQASAQVPEQLKRVAQPEQVAQLAKTQSILLVHGAWSDGSSFQKVIPLLQQQGFHVVSVQIPLTSFADDVATTKRALALENGPVLLVGHSYGGAVITEAGSDPKVTGLVYLAALAPEAGESTSSLLGSVPATPLFSELTQDSSGFLKVTEAGYIADFVEGLPMKDQRVLAATQEPTSPGSLGGVVTQPAWKQKPSWYVITDTDRAVSTDLQKFMANRIQASVYEVSSCHVVMFSHPEEVGTVIALAAFGTKW